MTNQPMSVVQLLREWPPGYGGVERVAHELASVWGGAVYSFDVQGQSALVEDPLPVLYSRLRLPSIKTLGRLHLPLPSRVLWSLLRSPNPLHGHLPSPGVLLVLVLARLVRPRRRITAHWHCFLEPGRGVRGRFFALYQCMALWLVPNLSAVITTSPLLAQELKRFGYAKQRVFVLPCCLSQQQESVYLTLPMPEPSASESLRVLYIGRLDSYKRLDWLLEALQTLRSMAVGCGRTVPRGSSLSGWLIIFPQTSPVHFYGRLDEAGKLLSLCIWCAGIAFNSSNEAFGIVQLEAMAGRPSWLLIRVDQGWAELVGSGLHWSQSPEGCRRCCSGWGISLSCDVI